MHVQAITPVTLALLLSVCPTAGLAAQTPARAQDSAQAEAPTPASSGRALWDGLVAAATGKAEGRVQAFQLDFDATRYSGDKQSNDISARYSYLAPGWVRMLLKSGRERLRGPEGDYLIDKSGVHRLVGRDFKQDIVELDESVTVARTFAHLTDPRGVEIERFERLDQAPQGLPPRTGELAAGLDWVRIWSRDFRGPRASGDAPDQSPPDRIDLGLERATLLPRLAILTYPLLPGSPPDALALEFQDYLELDGFRVPGRVTAWRLDLQLRPAGFRERADFDLWLKSGTLRPELSEADFKPAR